MFWRIVFCGMLAAGSLAQERPTAATPLQISGVLVDSLTGHPIRQARVAIAPVTNSGAAATVVTGEKGLFVFSNLKPGKYNLRAQRHGYLAQSFNEHDGFSIAIAVGPNLKSGNLVFRLPPESSIYGRISDEAGEPVGAQVIVYRIGLEGGEQGIHARQQVGTNDEGFYHAGHLGPGKYFVAVHGTVWYAQRPQPRQEALSSSSSNNLTLVGSSQDGYSEEQGRSPLDVVYPITYYPGVTEANAASTITLKPGERFLADISLQPIPALRIRIPGGAKMGGDTVTAGFLQLQSRILDESPIQIPAESQFLPSGDIEITGISPGRYQAEIFSTGPNGRKRSGEVEVFNSGEVHIEHEISSVDVSATVQREPGAAMPSSGSLSMHNLRTQAVTGGQVTSSGEVEFHELGPGKYEVFLNGAGNDFIKTVSAVGATVSGRTLEIKGAGPVKMNITVGHGHGEVNGVALREGKPLAGVMIVLVPSEPTPSRMLFRRDQSDSDGTFTLRAIVPGKYTLLALEKGWDLEWFSPSVLKPYLPGGEVLQVQADGKYEVKVKVQ